ncbi:RNA binding Pelota-like protein [Roseimicrobium gellanilyticum]|uniref:RNA binding Pelota-like protein n=1 Tax=Roseimicrobium gellanilyticum TaxID=748857 RepID=A0A366HP94_9BACT|nr:cysteine protease StiP domain-containing protein [Roseimicrobium gellanilyticum]RBP44606.1 RNA binding Pelota-like protein [Roseimicrobium gellanilyticum]
MSAAPTAVLNQAFHGSYLPEETTFLLRGLQMTATPLQERERLIQSGSRHYSELIGPEDAPTRERLRLFRECLENNGRQLAQDTMDLASALAESAHEGEVTITSIARAGTPIGALLWHLLKKSRPDLRVYHYSISVIRDRGADFAALRWIQERHAAESIRFVDGWTGKGTIATELRESLSTKPDLAVIDPGLWTPLDVCGAARYSPNARDYLIPSTLLGGTISGLVSRSVLPRGEEDTGVWHGSVELSHLRRYDLTRWFLRTMLTLCENYSAAFPAPPNASGGKVRYELAHAFLDTLEAEHGVASRNQIKLGIGETVRVLLRRLPKIVLLSPDAHEQDAELIRRLAALRNVPVQAQIMPFAAVALIANVALP